VDIIASIMSKPSKVEIALASAGLLLLCGIAYWALARNEPKPPTELFHALPFCIETRLIEISGNCRRWL
jgi:hypothetical protein